MTLFGCGGLVAFFDNNNSESSVLTYKKFLPSILKNPILTILVFGNWLRVFNFSGREFTKISFGFTPFHSLYL